MSFRRTALQSAARFLRLTLCVFYRSFNSPDCANRPVPRQLALPDPHDLPTGLSQGTRDQPVARHIPIKFTLPESRSALWIGGGAASRMSMPVAAVHKDSHALATKHEIWFSKQCLTSAPAGDSKQFESFNQAQLSGFVAVRADQAHDLGPLALGPNVSH
jgi:hypothetical protein